MKRSFPTFLLNLLSIVSVLTLPALLQAADYHVTPSGSGAKDGSSWSNALDQNQIDSLVDSTAPGDRVLLGSGTYTIPSFSINSSGIDGSPKGLIGVDTGDGLPLFQGNFDVHNNASSHFIRIPGAAHHWEIKNLRFKDQPFVITLVRNGETDTLRTNILFENLHFDTVEDAIRLYNASEILVKDCTVIRHTKKAFRIGDYSSFITFDSCFTDCNGGDSSFPSRSIPNGFAADDTDGLPIIHDITFIDCVALNNGYSQPSSQYWNGDGFSTERGAYNIAYIRCKAYGNNDAGFDNKASYITYQDCVSAGNSRGYRHWADNGQMFNCVASFNSKKGGSGSSYGLWVSGNGGELTIDYSTMHGAGHGISVENGGTATVSDSILSTTSSSSVFASSIATLIDTATYRPGEGTDPQYNAPDPTWQGDPLDSMDSQTYGLSKGYSSARVDETPNLAPTLTISSSSSGGVTPTTIDFTSTASDSDGAIISYLWDFGDGNFSNTPNATHTYNVPGDYEAECTVTDNRGAKASQSVNIVITFPSNPVTTRIESGNTTNFTDSNGNVWVADHSSDTGGGLADRGDIEIAGSLDDRIYQTERWGVSDYSIILANGIYEVKLHFAETFSGITAAGQRVFSVSAENTYPVGWTDIDVFDQAGGAYTALVKTGFVRVQDNILDLVFTASADNPMISGIEILPASSSDLPPELSANFYASDVQTDGFTVAWDPAVDETGVDSYDVYLDCEYKGTTSSTSYTFTDLSPYTSYFVNLRARDLNGNLSALSAEAVVKTLDDGTVGTEIILDNDAPIGVTFQGEWPVSSASSGYWGANYQHNNDSDPGNKSVTYTPDLPAERTYDIFLRWTSNNNRANNLPVDIIHAEGTSTLNVNQRSNGGEWNLLGTYKLAAGTANSVVLRTDNVNGYVIADAVRFLANDGTAPDSEAPSVPTNLQSSNLAATSFSLSWDASTDNIAVIGYEIYLDGSLHGFASTTFETISGLTAETTYDVTIIALDAAGNASVASSVLNVTTLADTNGGGGTPSEGILSFNLTDAGHELSSTDSLGAVAATNWHNSTVNNEVFIDATDSEGQITTLDIRFSNTAFFYPNDTPAFDAPITDDAAMMRTQRAVSNASSTAVYAEEVPYDSYDVYVYWGGVRSADTPPKTMTVDFQVWNGSAWVTQESKYISDDDRAWDGTYDESTATTSAEAVDGNEYVVFRARSDVDFKILTTAGRRIGLSGLQIVSRDSSGSGGTGEEGSSPQIISDLSAVGTYGDPFNYSILASDTPTSYAANGLPSNLSVNSATGEISGTLNTSGSFTIELIATNDYGSGSATLVLEVGHASQSIALDTIPNKTYGDGPFTVVASASSGLPVAIAVISGPAEISGNTITLNGAGSVTIEATQIGNTNYLPAATQQASFEVAPAFANLSLDGLWQVYDGAPADVAVKTVPASLATTLLFNGSPIPPTYPGTYDVIASIDNPNYQGETSGSLTIVATALVRNAPTLNGGVIGSVQLMEASSFNLNGGANLSGDLLLPGTPEIRVNGQPLFSGVVDAGGNALPDDYRVTINGGATLHHIVSRVNPPSLPAIDPEPAAQGTRNVSLNHPDDEIGELATLRNLTLNSDAGSRELPSGTYGKLTANGNSSFVLGSVESEEPSVYNLEGITLNGSSTSIQILGPVVINLTGHVSLNNGSIGDASAPESLWLRFADGDLTLNGSANLHGFVDAPYGKITLNGSSTLQGCITSDRLVINGNALLTWVAP